jgi:hypothetical protein
MNAYRSCTTKPSLLLPNSFSPYLSEFWSEAQRSGIDNANLLC